MIVTVNGKSREIADDATIASLVAQLAPSLGARGVAVALAGEVVPRAAWPDTPLVDGAQIEVVAAIQGG